jgi:hypothetical protein
MGDKRDGQPSFGSDSVTIDKNWVAEGAAMTADSNSHR